MRSYRRQHPAVSNRTISHTKSVSYQWLTHTRARNQMNTHYISDKHTHIHGTKKQKQTKHKKYIHLYTPTQSHAQKPSDVGSLSVLAKIRQTAVCCDHCKKNTGPSDQLTASDQGMEREIRLLHYSHQSRLPLPPNIRENSLQRHTHMHTYENHSTSSHF
jgi:hypothetical protein